jgi:hypothetical protein
MTEINTVRLSFVVAALLALAWIALGIWAMVQEGALPQTLWQAVQAVGLLLIPVAALFAVAAALGSRERVPVLSQPEPHEDAEAQAAGAATRLAALKAVLSEDAARLAETADQLEDRARATQRLATELAATSSAALEAGRTLEAILPEATNAGERLRLALQEAGTAADAQSMRAERATAALVDALEALTARGTTAAETMSAALATLEAQSERGRAQSEAGTRAIRGETDTLFELLENSLAARREAMARAGEAASGQLADAYARLEAMGHAASAQLAERLEALGQQAELIEARLKAQAQLTESVATSAERAFKLLDARLQHSEQTSTGLLDRLSGRVQQVSGELGALTQPLRDSQSAAKDLDAAVGRLRETTLQTVDVLGETLPARAVSAGEAADLLAADLLRLVEAIDGAHAKAAALAEPIAQGRAALEEATANYSAQRSAIEAAGQALVVELNQARTLIGEVEEQTRDTSLAAATRLVDAMTRVREVASQTTGTMRELLEGLVGEARTALASAADDAMRQSFAEPVAARMREAEAAAAAAAERTAASMAALASTLRLLDDRSGARLASLESEAQAELVAAATLLTERLSAESVNLASALGRPMDDADWAQWRRGERSLFNRRTVTLLEKRDAKELKELLARDPAFAASARTYATGFDSLIRRFETSAPALASALMGSDQGRLAALLTEALDR